jgi:ABC-type transport system involved in Fe-S cluster assembly fused permease/ATPase subunit
VKNNTTVVIPHWSSTIQDCDEIIMLLEGRDDELWNGRHMMNHLRWMEGTYYGIMSNVKCNHNIISAMAMIRKRLI